MDIERRVSKIEGRMIYVEKRQDNHAEELDKLTLAVQELTLGIKSIQGMFRIAYRLLSLAVAAGPLLGVVIAKLIG